MDAFAPQIVASPDAFPKLKAWSTAMAQPVDEHWQRNGRTDRRTDGRTVRRYQTYYLPCYAVDKYMDLLVSLTDTKTSLAHPLFVHVLPQSLHQHLTMLYMAWGMKHVFFLLYMYLYVILIECQYSCIPVTLDKLLRPGQHGSFVPVVQLMHLCTCKIA